MTQYYVYILASRRNGTASFGMRLRRLRQPPSFARSSWRNGNEHGSCGSSRRRILRGATWTMVWRA